MPQSWQVVCEDRAAFNSASPPRLPGGVRCEERTRSKVSSCAIRSSPTATTPTRRPSPTPSVMALTFDPDGRLIAKRVKTYITPTELGQDEGQLGLDLVPGAVSDSDAVPARHAGRARSAS